MEPKAVFDIFAQINQVPRPSKHEERISQWLQTFAAGHGIECVADEAMNVIMRVPATPGYENHEGVILQAHMDMVCEKNGDVEHDFMTDPIQTYVDGEFLKAKGTTLGADDGIGISMALAAITDPNLQHPAIECLFTVDEETGLTGAMKLQDGVLRSKRLINIDSEDDGQIFIGCAGGIDTLAKMHYKSEIINHKSQIAIRLSVTGLLGGHSGDDINKGRANANQLLVWFLARIWPQTELQLARIEGGNLRNAIAREAQAVLCVPMSYKEQIRIEWNHYVAQMEQVFGEVEKDMRLDLETCDMPDTFIPADKAYRLIMALCECPHGMIAMSKEMPGLVETSTNLASIKMKEEANGEAYIEINTSQRSSIEASKHHLKWAVEQALSLACDEVTHGDGYPGWAPNPSSALLEVVKKAYIDLYKSEPKVLAIHAGLECGLFLEKYPYLDMVSIGPQMYGVHSPQERLSIPSTERCYRWLCQTLQAL
ncbi:MAG: aminoacyl-histidine dipeptidase [Paludibacteraceae bacterium]|nr:aminoacyl-histidine dipeptidase [Paludibacteraceae bacterium]MBQ2189786.1 aminoacyl-histidine dipeptidase [Paludibacteraceae bacterium]MBQ2520653.1 aminoacyl-histidine dipeptidase [Paludibacteraceae bacterium]MBQ4018871.1 aminoacyl-histidine dipeptidase [Paludibacteraceae bacterium]MBQ5378857.1 aminoacyl-histidine dipeptidase [Paludibacteraceae bacterium]